MGHSWDGLLLSPWGGGPLLSDSLSQPSSPHSPTSDTVPMNTSHFLKGQALGLTDAGVSLPWSHGPTCGLSVSSMTQSCLQGSIVGTQGRQMPWEVSKTLR